MLIKCHVLQLPGNSLFCSTIDVSQKSLPYTVSWQTPLSHVTGHVIHAPLSRYLSTQF
jgi:hypothetical protein